MIWTWPGEARTLPAVDDDVRQTDATAALPAGRVDIHSHMIPGIDDGCQTLDESLRSVRTLIDHGYVATICTPHIWPELFPENQIEHIAMWTRSLQEQLTAHGVDYRVYPGGEVRIYPGLLDDFKSHGVPTLAGSRYVLLDYWGEDR